MIHRALTLPFRHLRWKIIAPFVGLTLLVAVAGTYLTTSLVAGSLEERFDNQLAEASRVTADAFVRAEQAHLEVVRAVAFTEGLPAAATAQDTARIERLVLPAVANAATERIEVLDASGALVYGLRLTDPEKLLYERLAAIDPYISWPVVADVVNRRTDARGDKFSSIMTTQLDGQVLYSAGPIYDDDRFAGVVLVGTPMRSLLPAVKAQALADVALYDLTGAPLATTFATESDSGLLAPQPAIFANISDGTSVRETKAIFGRDFDLLYGTLRLRGAPVGIYAAALPSEFIASATSVTRLQMTLLFSVGTAAVLAVGWVMANALTRPLARLAATADAVSAGDLTARSDVATNDEIGQLAKAFDKMTGTLQRQHLSTIRALASAIDARDPYTLGHSIRVGKLAASIGGQLGLSRVAIQHLEVGGYLHDIGKIGVRDAILLKPGTLTKEERELIEDHPRIGLQILEPIELAGEVRDFIAGHHEKLDGSGYPSQLRGDELSVFARIGAVADIYDALSTDRPYRTAIEANEVVAILMRQGEAGWLDPRVVNALARIMPEWEERRAADPALHGLRLLDPTMMMAAS